MEPNAFPGRQSKARGRKAWSLMNQESNIASAWGKNTGAAVAAVSMSPAPHHADRKKNWLMNRREEDRFQQKRAGGGWSCNCALHPQQPWFAPVMGWRLRNSLLKPP